LFDRNIIVLPNNHPAFIFYTVIKIVHLAVCPQ
jgi:hypothetical protein